MYIGETQPTDPDRLPDRTIWLLRRGRCEADNNGGVTGDDGLCADGLAQADRLAERLACENIEHIFTSPRTRALQTATPIARRLNLPILIEHGLDDWAPVLSPALAPSLAVAEDIVIRFPEIDPDYQPLNRPKPPESAEDVRCRALLTGSLLPELYGGPVLYVAHKPVLEHLVRGLLRENDLPLDVAPGQLVCLQRVDGQWYAQIDP